MNNVSRKKQGQPKARLNFRLDPELKEWVKKYAKRRGTDVTSILCGYLLALQELDRGDVEVEQI